MTPLSQDGTIGSVKALDQLRKALAARGYDKLIQTVRGAGYRFSASGL